MLFPLIISTIIKDYCWYVEHVYTGFGVWDFAGTSLCHVDGEGRHSIIPAPYEKHPNKKCVLDKPANARHTSRLPSAAYKLKKFFRKKRNCFSATTVEASEDGEWLALFASRYYMVCRLLQPHISHEHLFLKLDPTWIITDIQLSRDIEWLLVSYSDRSGTPWCWIVQLYRVSSEMIPVLVWSSDGKRRMGNMTWRADSKAFMIRIPYDKGYEGSVYFIQNHMIQ